MSDDFDIGESLKGCSMILCWFVMMALYIGGPILVLVAAWKIVFD